MPCDSSYLAPTRLEKESQRCAECLVYVFKQFGDRCPEWIVEVASDPCGHQMKLDLMVRMLCSMCRAMNRKEQSRIIYDGRSKNARQLADWWDEHKRADKARRKKKH
jgi:hypothetical protein